MIHVRIDIVPWGMDEGRDTIQHLYIANDRTGNETYGTYDVYVEDPRGRPYPRDERPGWVGRIEKFPRRLGKNALVEMALGVLRSEGWKRQGPE